MVSRACLFLTYWEGGNLTSSIAERVAGKDYSQGYKTYGFAAPFMSEKQVEHDSARVQAVH